MDFYNRRLATHFDHAPVSTYLAADLDCMIAEKRPSMVIVGTTDATHYQYVIRAMEHGRDVVCEKPMTTDAATATAVVETVKRTGRWLQVTFNFRYTLPATTIRELMMQGVVGTPTAVDFSRILDTRHGADYFRRWHRDKSQSGGLQIHNRHIISTRSIGR